MALRGGEWTLVRDRPDFTPLSFAQRFTGTFAADAGTGGQTCSPGQGIGRIGNRPVPHRPDGNRTRQRGGR
jgi:hypothetical protein